MIKVWFLYMIATPENNSNLEKEIEHRMLIETNDIGSDEFKEAKDKLSSDVKLKEDSFNDFKWEFYISISSRNTRKARMWLAREILEKEIIYGEYVNMDITKTYHDILENDKCANDALRLFNINDEQEAKNILKSIHEYKVELHEYNQTSKGYQFIVGAPNSNSLKKKVKFEYNSIRYVEDFRDDNNQELIKEIDSDNIDGVQKCILSGINLSSSSNDLSIPPLLHAISIGHTEIVELLISQLEGEDILCFNDEDFSTSMTVAVNLGYKDIVKLLLNYVNINYIADGLLRREPLINHYISMLDGDMVKYLLNKGADINNYYKDSSSSLLTALRVGCSKMVNLIISEGGLLFEGESDDAYELFNLILDNSENHDVWLEIKETIKTKAIISKSQK